MDRNIFFKRLSKKHKNIILNGCHLYVYFSYEELKDDLFLLTELSNSISEFKLEILLELEKEFTYLDNEHIIKFNANDLFSKIEFKNKRKTIYRLCNSKNEGAFQIAISEVAHCFNHLNNPNFIDDLAIIMKDQNIKKDWFFAFTSISDLKRKILYPKKLKKALEKNKIDLYKIRIHETDVVSCYEQLMFNKENMISFKKLDTFSILFE